MYNYLIISNSNELVRIAVDRVVYISSDGNYSILVQADGETRVLTYQLGELERMISEQLGVFGKVFVRIGRSLIINRQYIYHIDVSKQKLVLSDCVIVKHTLSASVAALKQLKELLEKDLKEELKYG